MKRICSLLLILCLLLTGCGTKPAPVSDPGLISAHMLLDRIMVELPELADSPEFVPPEETAAFLLIYGIDPALVADCAIARLGGARVFELAVIDLFVRTSATEEALLNYLRSRQGDFTGYAPEQAAIAEEGKLFAVEGGFRLILAITEDTAAVMDTLEQTGYTQVTVVENARIWEEEPTASPEPDPVTTADPEPPVPSPEPTPEPSPEPSPEPTPEPSPEPSPEPEPSFRLPAGWHKYTPPNIDDMSIYDTSAVLAAFEVGSDEGLNRKDKELYTHCKEVIEQVIRDGMSDYEKEWAIYSWLVTNVDYDWSHNDPRQTTPRDSFHPYGAIVRREAVCLGFATAFQLFMDLLDVECITVVGAASSSSEDHAWNMVRLNGEWYCVDATWDRGRGGSPSVCGYFNVTSDRMARTDHQWDYENTPMATATDGGR